MAGRTADALLLRAGDRLELERLTRSSTAPAAMAARPRWRRGRDGGAGADRAAGGGGYSQS
jgi:hypothetical protein